MKKRALLIVGLALMIAAAGVVYAAWTATLTTDAVINTGNVGVGWDASSYTDDPAANNWNDPMNTIRCTGGVCAYESGGITRYDRNVGQCDVLASGATLTITIGNAYPSYHCSIFAAVTNSGTIPVKGGAVTAFTFTRSTTALGTVTGTVVPTADASSHDQAYCTANPSACPLGVYFDGNALGSPDIMFDFAKGVGPGTTINPGASAEVRIWFHVQPEAEQTAIYTMHMTQDFVPWNG